MSYHENADVSSGATVLAAAAALRGELFHPFPELARRRGLLQRLNRLPPGWIRRIVEAATWRAGLSPKLAATIRSQDLAAWNVAQYDFLPPERRFEAILVGAPSGAAAYLASCLDAPFLSHTFLASFRQRNHPDDIAGYQRKGERLIHAILGNNQDLHIVNHYDPVHDRFLVSRVNHVRMKFLELPQVYREFIRQRLAPTGKLILLNCTAPWGQYTVKPRYTFQVGGLGGLTDQEFTRGSPRLDEWLRAQGSRHRGGWSLPMHWRRQPESEWGTLPDFVRSVESFSRQNHVPLRVVTGGSVEEFSRLAFRSWQWLYYLLRIRPQAILVDSFVQINASAPRKSAVLPLWLPFNCTDSRDFLGEMVAEFPAQTPVLFQPWPSFIPGPDMAWPADWHRALHGLRGRWLGVDPHRYPVDLAALAEMTPALADWLERHPDPLPRPLRRAEFDSLLDLLEESERDAAPETEPPSFSPDTLLEELLPKNEFEEGETEEDAEARGG